MKPEVYKTLAELNREFDKVLEALKVMEQDGVLTAEYVQEKKEVIEEMRAQIRRGLLLTD